MLEIIYEGIVFKEPDYTGDYNSTNIVRAAMRKGLLKRQPCEICGQMKAVHAHHEKYSEPLTIRWLCPSHHLRLHSIFRRLNPQGFKIHSYFPGQKTYIITSIC